jgi:hypothetical protein
MDAERAMRAPFLIGGDEQWERLIPEVELGALLPCNNYCQRVDPHKLQLWLNAGQLVKLAPAKRAIQRAEQSEQERPSSSIVGERNHSVVIGGG